MEVNLVNLFATVRDKHKAIVTGLTKDDFQVYEDGQPQEITNFSAESNLPITLGILIDTSGSEDYMLRRGERSGLALPGARDAQGRPGHGHVASTPTWICWPILPMTAPGSTAPSTARRSMPPAAAAIIAQGPLPTSGSGGTNFYDAVYLAAHDKLADEAGRKAIVVLTDCEDTGSKLG